MSTISKPQQNLLTYLKQDQIDLYVCKFNARQGPWITKHNPYKAFFICTVIHGYLRIEINEDLIRISAGEALFIPPNTNYRILGPAEANQNVRHINIRFALPNFTQKPNSKIKPIFIHRAQSLRRLAESFLISRENTGPCDEYLIRGHLLSICSEIINSDHLKNKQSSSLSAAQKHSIRQFISEHIHEEISPSDIAQHVGLSVDYFTRCFRSAFSVPPRRFLVEERMQQAAIALLETHDPIHSIATKLGIHDANYFARQFKKVFRRSPRQFRQEGVLPDQLQN